MIHLINHPPNKRTPSSAPKGRPSIARGVSPWDQTTTTPKPQRGESKTRHSLTQLRLVERPPSPATTSPQSATSPGTTSPHHPRPHHHPPHQPSTQQTNTLLSPKGAIVNSQGREPLESNPTTNPQAPTGRKKRWSTQKLSVRRCRVRQRLELTKEVLV